MLCFLLTMTLAATCVSRGSASLVIPSTVTALSTERVITCDHSFYVQRLSCASGVIVVQSAVYGRLDSEICSEGVPASQLSNTKCSQQGLLDVLKKRCDGKSQCEISPSVVRVDDPCFGIYKYVDTSFACFPARRRVVCESSVLVLSCDEGQVLFVYSADYGRRDGTTCSLDRPPEQLRNTQCSQPSSRVAERCNGRRSCTVTANNSAFGDPCVGTYKYLEVFYTCRDAAFSPAV
ncbi:L-rhamnose-binding lectin SML-like [Betta splendens]|uniref:L-rhamnose-binding lectin SML-like n=1 Tax=Betta splendens TaxID=158456 RepID=A0A6P7MYZ3_BETSP|nr:L-rhamnose-binding lectin SML-like [Betta splendens]